MINISRVRRLVFVLGGVMLIAFGSPAAAQTPTPTQAAPTPGGDCCTDHNGPGCDNVQCSTCVCGQPGQDSCCNDVWDATCVDVATNPDECASSCPCTPQPTATSGPTTPTPTPGGDCCLPHGGASCDDTRCAECVCDVTDQDVCCTDEWDVTCSQVAALECAGFCSCETTDCCSAHDLAGCESTTCEECVCNVPGQEFCCEEEGSWDAQCVSVAFDECLGSCACAPQDCCSPHSDPGCEGAGCLDCVCAIDPECCTVIWDQGCIDLATNDDECGGFCPCGVDDCCAEHDAPGCEGATCADCVCNTPGQEACCTEEWDATCAEVAAAVDDCAGSCACESDDCCAAHETAGCGDVECVDCVCTLDPFCCTDEWDEDCAALSAEECAGRCPCGTGDCCDAREDPGCGENACEDCVCDIDPTCCAVDGQWDQTCVEIASTAEECSDFCSCTDCCSPQGVNGCDDPTCAECVCNIEGQETCCTEVWDGQCAEVAAAECAAECPCTSGGCVGDCDNDGEVQVNELVRGVNILLEVSPLSQCPSYDLNNNGEVAINELVTAVNNLLGGCS